ncbi:glycosyl transferase-like protein [Dinothrombium tinctorium]|uniref:Glycosyl transferase-like protein n=1 Tax=Dinothrombium tinctorium TaxID=1965070 RepID=A0A443RP90_9ACAR|nr:glycosyl transferase-like protein [Dinothrombium tinctorium]
MGFEEQVYRETPDESKTTTLSEFVKNACDIMKKPPAEQTPWIGKFVLQILENTKFIDKQMSEIFETVKPDIVIMDYALPIPSLIKTNKPLVYVFSPNFLYTFYNSEKLPPASFGLSLSDKTEWAEKRKSLKNFSDALNEWLEENHYLRLCPLDDKWLGLDHSIRESNEGFKIPESFRNKSEKLIYLSMGTFGCNNVELMSRLCKLLAKCKHKIIVAKGSSHEMYELAENMWGEPYLPQVEVLPLVDLVIFHGGNNSFIETLYFGKPMIMMPLLWDQHDNAQRMVEMNIGIRLNPFTVEENELLTSIDFLLNDTEMAARLEQISNYIKASKSMDIAIERIEKIAENPKIPSVTNF